MLFLLLPLLCSKLLDLFFDFYEILIDFLLVLLQLELSMYRFLFFWSYLALDSSVSGISAADLSA
jgi:hypothetical protein